MLSSPRSTCYAVFLLFFDIHWWPYPAGITLIKETNIYPQIFKFPDWISRSKVHDLRYSTQKFPFLIDFNLISIIAFSTIRLFKLFELNILLSELWIMFSLFQGRKRSLKIKIKNELKKFKFFSKMSNVIHSHDLSKGNVLQALHNLFNKALRSYV